MNVLPMLPSPLPAEHDAADPATAAPVDGFAAMLAAVLVPPPSVPMVAVPVAGSPPEDEQQPVQEEQTPPAGPVPEPVAAPAVQSSALPAVEAEAQPQPEPAAPPQPGSAPQPDAVAPQPAQGPALGAAATAALPAALTIEPQGALAVAVAPGPVPGTVEAIVGKQAAAAVMPLPEGAVPEVLTAPVSAPSASTDAEPEPLTSAPPPPAGESSPAPQQPLAAAAGLTLPADTDVTVAGRVAPAPLPSPAEQLHPVIARLATNGADGTHRLTLRLHPEELGPVQVTVTVREGTVHVSLTALDDAQAVLQSGAPELRRMLEDAGLGGVGVDVHGGFDEGTSDQEGHHPAGGERTLAGSAGPAATPTRPQRSADSGAVDLRL